MRQSKRTYIGLAIVFLLSLSTFFLVPANREFLEAVAGIPLVGALIGAASSRRVWKPLALKEWNGQELSEELAVLAVTRRLRTILGVEELTKLRSSITVQATAGFQASASAAATVDQKAWLPGR